jgi:hypothetical protein
MADLAFSVRPPAFETLPPQPGLYESPQAFGVMVGAVVLSGELPSDPADISMTFLSTNQRPAGSMMTHATMMLASGRSPRSMPTGRVPSGASHISFAARYETDTPYLTRVDVLLDTPGEVDVRALPAYWPLLSGLALGLMTAVRERHDSRGTGLMVHHAANFSSRSPEPHSEQFRGRSIDEIRTAMARRVA